MDSNVNMPLYKIHKTIQPMLWSHRSKIWWCGTLYFGRCVALAHSHLVLGSRYPIPIYANEHLGICEHVFSSYLQLYYYSLVYSYRVLLAVTVYIHNGQTLKLNYSYALSFCSLYASRCSIAAIFLIWINVSLAVANKPIKWFRIIWFCSNFIGK